MNYLIWGNFNFVSFLNKDDEGGFEVILAVLAVLVIIPLIVMLFRWLWNTTMPDVFNLREITFWQAFRLLLIAGFLFQATGGSN